MLNPSTADEFANDPTVERCQRRAEMMGFEGFTVTNLFAWRSTDKSVLPKVAQPIGEAWRLPLEREGAYMDLNKNDEAITREVMGSQMVICAWGNDGALLGRSKQVLILLRECGVTLHALKLTATGEPQHPLYLGYAVQPREWRP